MRLCEIDDQDRTWAKTAGINLDIDSRCVTTLDILNMLSKIKSPQLRSNWMPTVEIYRQELTQIINADLADDVSTAALKNNARKILHNIDALISKL